MNSLVIKVLFFLGIGLSLWGVYFRDSFVKKRKLQVVLFLLGLISVTLFLSIDHFQKSSEDGFYILLDTSRSMLADDYHPSRIEHVKKELKKFVIKKESNIGIFLFSEELALISPLTSDKEFLLDVIDSIKVGQLGEGTNISDNLFQVIKHAKENKVKNVILLSDGIDLLSEMSLEEVVGFSKKNKIMIHTVPIGRSKDALIPSNGIEKGHQKIPGGSFSINYLKNISQKTRGKNVTLNRIFSLKTLSNEKSKIPLQSISVFSFVLLLLSYSSLRGFVKKWG